MRGAMKFAGQKRMAAWAGAMLASSSIAMMAATPATAQTNEMRSFDIAAQPLQDAIVQFHRQSGIQITASGGITSGRTAGAVRGRQTAAQALGKLLAGTGLHWRWVDNQSVALEPVPEVTDGTLQLGILRVEGASDGGASGGGNNHTAGWDGTAGTVYVTPGSVSVITKEQLEAYPAQSPADMLRGTTGIISGEARTSGGLDVNIRGLQGQGRVPVTVDGAINGTTVYRGYQGTSNRSFVDPDFISHISIEKGPSMGNAIAGGIGGSISMSTISAADIVPDGDTMALRLKASISTNSSAPGSQMTRSLLQPKDSAGDSFLATRENDRPGFLTATGGSGSLVFARKSELLDIVAGYSFRRSGNYHAGSNGKYAPQETGTPSQLCASSPTDWQLRELCARAIAFYDRYGSTPFVGGEEVLNSSTDTESVLVKATLRPADDHILELGYGGYWTVVGENYPASLGSATATVFQADFLSRTSLDRFTARYRWNPASEMIDLKVNGWLSKLEEAAPSFGNFDPTRRYVDSWGADLANSSRLATPAGRLSADYGASILREKAGPVDKWMPGGSQPPGREGTRREVSLFSQFVLEPAPWLRLDAGLRYQHYKLRDQQSGTIYNTALIDRAEDAVSYSLGAAVMPLDGLQLFASYKQAARLPSLMEATTGFFMIANPDLHKEEAHNWEAGANYIRTGVFADNDDLGVKLAWFDNDIEGYISRRYVTQKFAMQMYNIDRAQFRGLEASISYKTGGFSLDAGATWYDRIQFCRTASAACIESSLASDYATNYIPPRWSANLHLNQKLFGDRAAVGARITYVGKRAGGAEKPQTGYMPLISAIEWHPYVIADINTQLKIADGLSFDASVDNLFDRYYNEAMSLGYVPAPGRTFRIGITSTMASKSGMWPGNWFGARGNADPVDWSGPYVGADFAYGLGRIRGDVTDSAGNPADRVNGSRVAVDPRNAMGGLHAGFNYQLPGDVVLGIEAGLMTANLGGSTEVAITEESTSTEYLQTWHKLESDTRYNMDRLVSLRGRLGYSLGRTLLYGTAGIGWLRETDTRNQYRSTASQNRGIGTDVEHYLAEKDRKTRTGLILGGGVERAIGSNWSMRAEYDYGRFGRKTFRFDKARAGISLPYSDFESGWNDDGSVWYEFIEGPGNSTIVTGRKVNSRADLHMLRVGVSYRF